MSCCPSLGITVYGNFPGGVAITLVCIAMSKKFTKRRRRKLIQLLQQESTLGLSFTDSPTKYLCVGNGGMSNGITPALLKHLLPGSSFQLFMPRRSSVAFVEFPSVAACQEALLSVDGLCVQDSIERLGVQHLVTPSFLTGPSIHLYLFFLSAIPTELVRPKISTSCGVGNGENCGLPQGLALLYEFITASEELSLLNYFHPTNESQWMDAAQLKGSSTAEMISSLHRLECQGDEVTLPEDKQMGSLCSCDGQLLSPVPLDIDQSQFLADQGVADRGHAECSTDCSKTLRLRTVKHFGYKFLYGTNTVDISHPLPGGIPALCTPLLRRITSSRLVDHTPDQLTVNVYKPGEGKYKILVGC